MRRAVAFCSNIRASNKIKNTFNSLNKDYADKLVQTSEDHKYVQIESRHVDGSMNSQESNADIQWLKDTPEDGKPVQAVDMDASVEQTNMSVFDNMAFSLKINNLENN